MGPEVESDGIRKQATQEEHDPQRTPIGVWSEAPVHPQARWARSQEFQGRRHTEEAMECVTAQTAGASTPP